MTCQEDKALTRRLYDEMSRNDVDALPHIGAPDDREATRLSPEPLTREQAGITPPVEQQ